MPEQYIRRRDQLKRQGYSDKGAKHRAAREYNSRRKPGMKPVTRGRD